MLQIFQVRTGDFDGHRVVYDTVASFTNKRQADMYVRRLKADDAYTHQYTEVVPVRVYKSVSAFELAGRLMKEAES